MLAACAGGRFGGAEGVDGFVGIGVGVTFLTAILAASHMDDG
jgi:hypothetical protein